MEEAAQAKAGYDHVSGQAPAQEGSPVRCDSRASRGWVAAWLGAFGCASES